MFEIANQYRGGYNNTKREKRTAIYKAQIESIFVSM